MSRKLTTRSLLLVIGLVALIAAAAGGGYAATQGGATTANSATFTHVVVNRLLQPGAESTIGSAGPLTITARCNPGAPATAQYVLHTNAAHTSMDAGPQNNDFGPGSINFWGSTSVYEANFEEGSATSHQFNVYNTNATLAGGGNVQHPGQCQFGGVFYFVTSTESGF